LRTSANKRATAVRAVIQPRHLWESPVERLVTDFSQTTATTPIDN
jgi:hypothetical protein